MGYMIIISFATFEEAEAFKEGIEYIRQMEKLSHPRPDDLLIYNMPDQYEEGKPFAVGID